MLGTQRTLFKVKDMVGVVREVEPVWGDGKTRAISNHNVVIAGVQ